MAETSMGTTDDVEACDSDSVSSFQHQQLHTISSHPLNPPTSNATTTLNTSTASESATTISSQPAVALEVPMSTVEELSSPTSPAKLRLIDIASGSGDDLNETKSGEKEEGGDGSGGPCRLLKVVKTNETVGEPIRKNIPGEERVV